jgi:PhoH-like ATPase
LSKDIVVIEGFEDWNTWYAEGKIELDTIVGDYQFYPNQGVVLKGSGCKEHGLVKGSKIVRVRHYDPCDISPKNTEQTIALSLLRDPQIPLVILSGVAGSGKTLLACAHALDRLQSRDHIEKVIICKSMSPVGREIGFLPGDMGEKVIPWLGPFYDNFRNCGYGKDQIEIMIEKEQLEITPITYIQGRSISNAVIIIDEVQNLDLMVLKQIITRAAQGTQIILLGDQTQVFERVQGQSLNTLLEKGRPSSLIGTIHLEKTQRSAIADWAVRNL